jgi:hypothetical protein
MDHIWIWLVAGLVPYCIKRHRERGVQTLQVCALFWSLMIQTQNGSCSWFLYIPLIEQLRSK